jgi:hypothetical protein
MNFGQQNILAQSQVLANIHFYKSSLGKPVVPLQTSDALSLNGAEVQGLNSQDKFEVLMCAR